MKNGTHLSSEFAPFVCKNDPTCSSVCSQHYAGVRVHIFLDDPLRHLVLVINHVTAVADQQPNCDNLFLDVYKWIEQAFDGVHDQSDLFSGVPIST